MRCCPVPQSLKVIYSEDPAALQAIADLLLLQEQTRSMVRHATCARCAGRSAHACGVLIAQGELAMNYSHALAQAAQSGQMFGVRRLRRLAAEVAAR